MTAEPLTAGQVELLKSVYKASPGTASEEHQAVMLRLVATVEARDAEITRATELMARMDTVGRKALAKIDELVAEVARLTELLAWPEPLADTTREGPPPVPERRPMSDDLRFWRWAGLFSNGHVTYAPGRLGTEGPFSNPARMIEDIMGHDPACTLLDGRSESEFYAAVWTHAGWWDS